MATEEWRRCSEPMLADWRDGARGHVLSGACEDVRRGPL